MDEWIIESSADARDAFQEFCNGHDGAAHLEETKSADGLALVSLVIEKLPPVITAIAALLTALNARKLPVRVRKNGRAVPVDELTKPKTRK